jgi:cytochrome c biogenesis protein CcdA
MLRLIGLMISIGFADSVNPSTIAPAMYLATDSGNARRQVTQFTLAVFAVYLVGGLAVALGPGELLLHLVPHPRPGLKYLFEIIGGVVLLTLASVLWAFRRLLIKRELPEVHTDGRSSALLGATITAVELPTAFPYFAAIAAVVGADLDVMRVVFLILIFNVCFIGPLLGILATLTFAGPDAQRLLARGREWLEARWPAVLAALALLAGLIVTLLGVTGLAAAHHNDFGTFARRLRRYLHLHH